MEFSPHAIAGVYEVTLSPRVDHRGYFVRTYAQEEFEQRGLATAWVHANQSQSAKRHTLRGLHFQYPPDSETKLVRVLHGAILDVFVDLRPSSPSYGKWGAVELTSDGFRMLYLPRGIAHGFCTLTDNSVVHYQVDAAYAPANEGGFVWNDPTLAIEWPTSEPIVSERDANLPLFDPARPPFPPVK